MTLFKLIFCLFEFITALSACSILFVRNVLYAALLLIICLLSLAGIYVMTGAEFLGISQILIYAGGILVLVIFGIMLTGKAGGKPLETDTRNIISGTLVGLSFLVLLGYAVAVTKFDLTTSSSFEKQQHHVEQIGVRIMSDYAAPFELAGLLLLVSLIGAAVIASVTKQKKNAAR